MKLKILEIGYGETDLGVGVDQSESATDIRSQIFEYIKDEKNRFLIFVNFIMGDEKSIKFYTLSEKSEINMKIDEVVLDVFLVGKSVGKTFSGEMLHLVVKIGCSYAYVKKILTFMLRENSENIEFLNVCRGHDEDGEIVDRVNDTMRELKLICKCGIKMSSDECFYAHNTYLLNKLEHLRIYAWFKNYLLVKQFIALMANIKEIIVSLIGGDENFPFELLKGLRHSKFLSCICVADEIYNTVYDNKRSAIQEKFKDKYPEDQYELYKFDKYFRVALNLIVLDFPDHLAGFPSVSLESIVHDTIRYLAEFTENFSNDFPKLINRLHNQLFLECQYEPDLSNMKDLLMSIMENNYVQITVPSGGKSIRQLKAIISIEIGIPSNQIYLLDNTCDKKPEDEDLIDMSNWMKIRYVCQIIKSADNLDVIKEIGEGSYGRVMLCLDTSSRKQFALKKSTESDLVKDIFYHSKLYPSIFCSFLGIYIYQGTMCIAIDYLPGGTLRSYIENRKGLPEEEVSKLCYYLLQQLSAMHKQGIIHRDIKPENIVLDDQNNPKLIDFGLSKYNPNSIGGNCPEIITTSSQGTMVYAAPELSTADSFTNKIDTWSLGVTVIEMLTGESMLVHNDCLELFKIDQIDFQPPLSKGLRQFMNSCLEENPEKRASIEELLKSDFILQHSQKVD